MADIDLSKLSDEDLGIYEDLLKQRSAPAVPGAPGGQPPGIAKPIPSGLQDQPDNFWTSPNGLIRSGARKAIGGVEHMAEPGKEAKYSGASDLIRGVGRALTPAAIGAAMPAMATAPIPTIVSAVLGSAGAIGGGLVGKYGAKAIGASPEGERLSGDVGGLIGGGAGAYGGSKLPNLMRVDPRVAVNRSLRPVPSNSDFSENIPQTLSTIKAVNPGFKPAMENGELNLIPAANRAIKAHQEALEPWLQRAEGQRISGEPIVNATRQATQGMLPSEGQSGDALVQRAQQDYRDFSPQELRDRLTLLNERMSPFYNKALSRQSSALADIPDAVLKAQRDAAADTLYRGLDPENQGAGPRLIQSRTGNLIDIRDAAQQRNNAILAEQPLTPLGRIVDPLKGFARSMLPGKGGAGIAYAEGSEGRSLPLLQRAFKAVPEAEGANELGMLPRPGPRALMPPPDISGPRIMAPQPGFEQRVQGQRLLPPASSPIGVSGVVAPDMAGNIQQGMRQFASGPRQLTAPTTPIGVSGTSVPDYTGQAIQGTKRFTGGPPQIEGPVPGVPPINILPTGPGAIGPAGTVPVRSTEQGIRLRGILGGRLLNIPKPWLPKE